MVKFSIFLILIAFAILGFALSPMVSPNDTSLLNLMEPLLCDPGDNILQQTPPLAGNGGTSNTSFAVNMSLICKRADASTYNVTDKLLGIGVVGFVSFLLFGVLFFIIGIIRNLSGGGNQPQPAGAGWTPPYYTPTASPTPMPTPSGGAYPQVTVTPQPNYGSNSYPTAVGYSAPTMTPRETAPSDKFNFDSAATMQNIPKPSTAAATSSAQGGGELTKRLKQLREAYDAGLISSDEYERTKSDLLRDFSDDN